MHRSKGSHAVPREKRPYKYASAKEKNAAKRARRLAARKRKRKKPLIEPLFMSEKGVVEGKLFLKDGKQEISVELIRGNSRKPGRGAKLQGVFRTPSGEIFIVRLECVARENYLTLSKFQDGKEKSGHFSDGFFYVEGDHAHMKIPVDLRGRGLGSEVSSKIIRHRLASTKTKSGVSQYSFFPNNDEFLDFFRRMGFEFDSAKIRYTRKGKTRKTNDMRTHHSIEAIDPKTGKVREYVFPVDGKNK